MRLKRLELQGFKSFLDRTILTFDPGITGVVGPNGCGKSNIVDAIQWVMGEQSAKHLRGDSMTDVIFNGSDTRPPSSIAEVSLILDRAGVALSPAFGDFDKGDEISITRRVHRDGTGEYLINKSTCRLRDIHELFMDTGVGKRAYSIIEQGQIDRMINVKPDDRRLIFEEVAGITKYKAKRKEAERKLEATRGNMVRLQDIITELEKQIRSLKIQATRARKYKELKVELETVDLHLLGRNLYTHKKAIDEMGGKREGLVLERSESDAKFAEVDAELTQLEVRRIDQEKQFKELTDQDHALSLTIQKMEGKLTVLEERKRFLQEASEELVREENDLRGQIEQLEASHSEEEFERSNLRSTLQAVEDELSNSEQVIRERQEEKHRAQQRLNSLQGKKVQLSHRAVSLQNQKNNLEQKEKENLEAQDALNQKLSDLVVNIEKVKEALVDAEKKIEAVSLKSQQAEAEVTALHSECQSISKRLSELEENLFGLREVFHSKKSRLESLKELQENLEGYSPTAREVLLKLRGQDPTSIQIHAVPLAEVLKPAADVEQVVEVLLGPDMNTLLVPNSAEAEQLARSVNDRDMEKVKVVALSEIDAHVVYPYPEGCTPLLSKVEFAPDYEKAGHRYLSNVFLCDNADQLFQLRQSYPQLTFLIPDGRIVSHSDRAVSGGVLPTQMGVFERRREIETLTEELAQVEVQLKEVTTERENLFQHLQNQEALHAQSKDTLSSIHIERVECRKEREAVQHDLNRIDREYTGAQEQSQRNIGQLDSIREQVEKNRVESETVVQEEEAVATQLVEAEENITKSVQALEAVIGGINEKKIERTRLEEKVNAADYKLQRIESEKEQHENRCAEIEEQKAENEKELGSMDEEAQTIVTERESSQQLKSETQVKISEVQTAFNETCQVLQTTKEQRDHLSRRREEALRELQEVELKLAQEQSSYEHLCGLSVERYHREPTPLDESVKIDVTQLPLFADQIGSEWDSLNEKDKEILLQEHLKNMREKISRYGEVNLTAIQEFDEIQQRFDFLTAQKTDLEKSIAILEEAIVKIDETTKVKFEETFTAVNRKFQEIFPILFNGGKAELTLVQLEGHAEIGVDIMAQPPGKRLQSITLLSGGEKALTAVSLVLAIFARKPSPFCLLDEVDAPLDDANVSRFNTVIRKMAEKTQFIVITHNKKTMEIAEALYGVTMERAGISKMTSVRLQ